ncbi:hypothetical protein CHARACLAT_030274 [Characodon lateralis]|uniref:Uncharacterized protein n=1 Tax=Characodon lateralis TaxID=208331 RepID=A0ABU7EYM3_9TELE|nr:hypothetical protein [Characodon lateralis]
MLNLRPTEQARTQLKDQGRKIISALPIFCGRAHGAIVEALVDGSGRYSAWDSELCLSCLPPFRHHHLLQGDQKVRGNS